MKETLSHNDTEQVISTQAGPAVEETPEAEHDESVRNFVEKGFAKDVQEAENFVKTLRETLRASEEIGKELDSFEAAFDRVVSDAETHLADLEKDMEGSFGDRGEVFRQVAEQLAVNFDEVIRSEKSGPYRPNVARRFANFVLQNKAALVAVTVFTAVLRLGGGVAHAAEAHPYAGDHPFDGSVPYGGGEDFSHAEHSGPDAGQDHSGNHFEDGHVDPGRDFEQVSDLITHASAESGGYPDAESIHAQIGHLHSMIENGEGDAGQVVVDQKSGDIDGTFDMRRLQEEMRAEGSVRLSVQSYSEIHVSETNGNVEERFESVFSVGQVHEAARGHDHGFGEDLKMTAEGGTPEEAALHAINELSEYMGVHVSNETSSEIVENGTLTTDSAMSHTVVAGSHVIDISSIEVMEQKSVDGDGHLIVTYAATIVGHGI